MEENLERFSVDMPEIIGKEEPEEIVSEDKSLQEKLRKVLKKSK